MDECKLPCIECDCRTLAGGCLIERTPIDGACDLFRPLPRPVYEELDRFGMDDDYGPGGARYDGEAHELV